MKRVIRCYECVNCAVGYGTGFTGDKLYYCSKMEDYVSSDDGCTIGVKGNPGSLCISYDVIIDGHETVYGY